MLTPARWLARRLLQVRPAIRSALVAVLGLVLVGPALGAADPRIPRTPPGQGQLIALLRWLGTVPPRVSGVLKGIFKRDPSGSSGSRLGWYVLLASVPALAIGYLLRHMIESLFREPMLEAGIRLLMTTLLLILAELLGREKRSLSDMKWLDALIIGLFVGPVVLVGFWTAPEWARGCHEAARIDNGQDVDNEELGGPVLVCAGTTAPWSRVWDQVRHLNA